MRRQLGAYSHTDALGHFGHGSDNEIDSLMYVLVGNLLDADLVVGLGGQILDLFEDVHLNVIRRQPHAKYA